MILDVETRIDGRPMTGTLVTATFFQILGTSAAAGRALTPADDGPVVVLSNRGWTKLFPGGSAAIGQTLLVNGLPFAIVGVMPPDFRGLQLVPPDYWAPLTQLGRLRPSDAGREDAVALDVVAGRLRPGLTPESATAALTAWAAHNPDLPAFRDQPKTIRLLPMQGTVFDSAFEALASFAPLFMAFGLILLIGCANVANLLLARGLSRQREIGIRLALGASRKRIVRQLLTENCLLALAAAGCGLLLSRVVLHGAIRLAMATVPPDAAELLSLAAFPPDWRVFAFLLAGAFVSTLVFALAPALQATRLELVRTMRGEVKRDARPGFARHALLAVQVSASALLLVCAAVFLRSALAAASVETQVRVVDTVFIDGIREERRDAMLRAIDADPAIAAVAAAYPGGLRGQLADASSVAGGDSDGTRRTVPVNYKFVSPEYFSLLEIEVVGGRGFAADERSALSGVAIVSDSTARQLWPDGAAV